MIKFFRRIRQKLLSENNLGKYLIYAIGEIVLVVIGILIALTINNWNENNKIRNLELTLLDELKANLKMDIIDMEENIRFHERSIQSANIILTSFDKGLPAADSLHRHFGNVALAPKFLVTMTAYNSLNNEGMRIIRNDSLRLAITSHYQRNYAYLLSWNESEWNTLFDDQRDIYRKFFKDYDYLGDVVPVNYNDLARNQYYRNYLNNRIGVIEATIRYYRVFGIKNAKDLIDQIDSELNSRLRP